MFLISSQDFTEANASVASILATPLQIAIFRYEICVSHVHSKSHPWVILGCQHYTPKLTLTIDGIAANTHTLTVCTKEATDDAYVSYIQLNAIITTTNVPV